MLLANQSQDPHVQHRVAQTWRSMHVPATICLSVAWSVTKKCNLFKQLLFNDGTVVLFVCSIFCHFFFIERCMYVVLPKVNAAFMLSKWCSNCSFSNIFLQACWVPRESHTQSGLVPGNQPSNNIEDIVKSIVQFKPQINIYSLRIHKNYNYKIIQNTKRVFLFSSFILFNCIKVLL